MNKLVMLTAAAILLLSLFLRLYQLGKIPGGLTWDEAAIGYNGYSIITTRRDEWLTLLPISFKSFGDYKAPLAIYLNGFFTFLLGLNPFAVRLPFALSGVAAVGALMLLIREFWHEYRHAIKIALLAGAILALSPWHLQFTRTGFESGLALTLIIWATYFFIRFAKNPKSSKGQQLARLVLSALLFSASLYTYHSTKIFAPLWVVYLAIKFRRSVFKNMKHILAAAFVGFLATIPLVYDSLFGAGLERAGVTLFAKSETIASAIVQSCKNFLIHLSPQFLMLGQIDSFRHGDGVWGVLLPTTAVMFYVALAFVLLKFFRKDKKYQKILSYAGFFIVWTVLGLIPAAIGEVVPHSNRSLMALPGIIGLAIIGVIMTKRWLESISMTGRMTAKSFLGSIAVIHVFLFAAYFDDYLTFYPAKATEAYNEGYLEMFEIAKKYEYGIDNFPKVDQIVISSAYGQPVIYSLFSKQLSPYEYHQGGLIKYLFLDQVSEKDLTRENSLVVATSKDDLSVINADHLVRGSDGSIRFKIYYTGNN